MRKRIFEIVEKSQGKDILSSIYDVFMLIAIFVSIVPLMIKEQGKLLISVDYVCAYIFIFDYLLRWVTADYKLKTSYSFLIYPITPFAIIDLLSILPTFGVISRAFKVLRLLRVFKVIRILKALRYSKQFKMISNVIKKNKGTLYALLVCALFYIFVSALMIFSIEKDSFNDFFEALYWATTALTTVGYGDIYPLTTGGRIISMISSFFGIAIVALPSGVITAGFVEEIDREKQEQECCKK